RRPGVRRWPSSHEPSVPVGRAGQERRRVVTNEATTAHGGWGVVVIGAGSAGAVMASRVSEDPARRVLLVEAAAAYTSVEDVPAELLDPAGSAAVPGHRANWDLTGEFFPGFSSAVPRGKVVGGSSAINGCYFIRGTRANFD